MKFSKKCVIFAFFIAILSQILVSEEFSSSPVAIAIESVDVTVDSIAESAISEQICDIARTKFSAENFSKLCPKVQNARIRISIRERSFYRSADNINSLYVHYGLYDGNENCITENAFCSEGKRTIISTVVQRKEVDRIARDLQRYFKP